MLRRCRRACGGWVRLMGPFAGVCAVAALAPGLATAGRVSTNARPTVLHLTWKKVAHLRVLSFVQSGQYAFAGTSAKKGVLFDTETGTRTQLSVPVVDCSGETYDAIGGGRLMLYCANSSNRSGGRARIAELYSLTHKTWRAFDYSNGQKSYCLGNLSDCFITPVALGTHWIEFGLTGGPNQPSPGAPAGLGFENIGTKAWRQTSPSDPPGENLPGLNSQTMLDLNSPALLVPVCAPIRLPHHGELNGYRSPILMFGRYALVGSPSGDYQSQKYIERCGQSTRLDISNNVAFDSHGNGRVLIWNPTKNRQLHGMFLGTGRRLVSTTPISGQWGPIAALTPQDVFMVGSSVWEAQLPRSATAHDPTG